MTIAALLFALIATPGVGESSEPVLLDFHASWCGPCQQMRPVVKQLIQSGYPVRSIDIDHSPALAERYNVTEVPTFIVVDGSGRALARTQGYQPATQLAQFYRAGKAKAKATPPAPAEDENARDEEDEEDDAPRGRLAAAADPTRPTFRNPKPWETVVRIRVHGNGMIGFGSGTIIHSTPEESIVLTCAHIFKLEGQRQAHPSRFPRRIDVDLFDGKLNGQNPPMVHFVEAVQGKAIDYDFSRDVGLILIRPGRRLPASRVVPTNWAPRSGMRLTAVGCPEGQDATAWSTAIEHPFVQGLAGSPSYEAIECTHAPKQGRSGGGLYNEEGYIVGVCDFAEPRGNHGLYATPRSIRAMLDRNNLMALYAPIDRRNGPLLTQNRPVPARTIARGQSPEREDASEVTIPPPELLGIKPPHLAQSPKPNTANGRAWHASNSGGTTRVAPQRAELTDLKLPPAADNDRFAPMPEDTDTPLAAIEHEERPASRSLGKWRAVREEK